MPHAPGGEGGPGTRLRSLLTIRISSLSELLRRSSTLANRRAFGLSWIEWRVMAQVGEHAPLTLNALAEVLNLDPGQVSRAVKGLIGRDLVSRTRRPGGPSVLIALTEPGRALHARMVDLAIARHDFLTGDISDEEIEQAARVLDRLRHRAELLLARERDTGAAPEG